MQIHDKIESRGKAGECLNLKASTWSASFAWLVGGLGVLVAIWKLPSLFQFSPWEVLFLVVLAVVLEAVPVPMGKAEGTLIFVVPLGITGAYSPSAAICVLVIAELITPLIVRNRREWSVWLFNAGQYGLSAFAMSQVFQWLTGSTVSTGLNTWSDFFGILVAGFAFIFVNHIFIVIALWTRGDFILSDFRELVLSDGLNFAVAFPFVLLFIVTASSLATWTPLLMTPLGFINQFLRVYRRMSVLSEIQTAVLNLTSEFDIDTICEQAAATARRTTSADAVAVYILSDTGDVLVPNIIYPPAVSHDFDLAGIEKSGGGVIWSIIESGKWGYVPHTQKDERVLDDGSEGRYYLSMAVFPMQTRGQLQGAIVLYALRPYVLGVFAKDVQVLSGQVAVLIENAKLYQQLQEQSWHDGATGLYNYRFLYEELERRMRFAQMSQQPVSLAVLDLDYFKKFNDTYGHLAGDAVLKSVASLLKNHAGDDAVVARYGGEEFAVIMPVAPEAAYERVEAIRVAVLRHIVEFQGFHLQGITVSGGIASHPAHAADDRDLLLKADSAMYWGAKERGRNRVAMYTPEFDAQLFVDQLTGLYTYHFINIRVREQIEQGVSTWGVLCLDLEKFSFVNASFGYEVGDQILRQASRILSECLRSHELACRFSGDEFLVLLPSVSADELNAIAERVQRAIQSHRYNPSAKNVALSVRVRRAMQVYEDIDESWTLFEKVGQLFGGLNEDKVSENLM